MSSGQCLQVKFSKSSEGLIHVLLRRQFDGEHRYLLYMNTKKPVRRLFLHRFGDLCLPELTGKQNDRRP